jgi:8-oxo-dGTP pyrophosphatase MutT (NUDIX family)
MSPNQTDETAATAAHEVIPQDVKDLVAAQPGVLFSAAAVILDARGRLVVVNPSYKDGWELPGGMADEGEDPYATARREVAEEIGLDLALGRLLLCDVTPAYLYGRTILHFVFDAPVLDDAQARDLRSVDLELIGAAALPLDRAFAALHPRAARRARTALALRDTGGFAYLVDGTPVA